jgi:hypothetical protein
VRATISMLLIAFAVTPILARTPPPLRGTPPPWNRAEYKFGIDMSPIANDGHGKRSPIYYGTSGAMLPLGARGNRPLFRSRPSSSVAASNEPGAPESRVHALDVPVSVSPLYTATANNGQDVEPSLTSFTNGGVTYTTEAYSKNIIDSVTQVTHFRVMASTFSNLTSSSSAPIATYLFPLAAGPSLALNESGDPMVAANPYPSGVRPGAVYASFFTGYRPDSGSSTGNPMQIMVWGSDNGGQTWNSSSIAAATASTDTYTLDKPVMDVSWYYQTLGYIYVAWVESTAPGATRIMLQRNTGGLATRCRPAGGGCVSTWDQSPTVIADYGLNENPLNPQVVVNPDNGDVYVFWVNFYGQLRLKRLSYATQAWSGPITVVQNINLITDANGFLPNFLRALVVPAVKYNTATHSVMAVWHARTAAQPTNETAIYYASFDAATISQPVAGSVINDAAASQIQPAIDNDDAGNMLVSYFSTQNSPYAYQLFGLCLAPSGSVSCLAAPLNASSGPNEFIGDYHENVFWNFTDGVGSRWHTSWTLFENAVVTGVK